MIFRANYFQPVAGATGVASRVQLPPAGRLTTNPLGLSSRPALPATAMRTQARGHLGQQRTQHQVQCRANCMSKANF
ncbi:hypothetical protein [Hymenobacter negativus]|uniref:Uncharacterized protein n=1 Tax=Hymenobacter negativus TaxID=2795026 RepID=A0ABS0Q9Y3_9BACT|nr:MULTISPECIES: hypothetical protein [Bacteria]MBH8559484.1 hypothetical protein [Hymenobacter negativus]MBH8568416.1 hypothetical protein [Hymenobacter negativus]MBR7208151.1 hypothetical protein [Microvirga sp. STS02]